MRLVLLSAGFAGIDRELQSLEGGLKEETKKAQREAVKSLREYLRGNAGRLNDAERLAAGRAICTSPHFGQRPSQVIKRTTRGRTGGISSMNCSTG